MKLSLKSLLFVFISRRQEALSRTKENPSQFLASQTEIHIRYIEEFIKKNGVGPRFDARFVETILKALQLSEKEKQMFFIAMRKEEISNVDFEHELQELFLAEKGERISYETDEVIDKSPKSSAKSCPLDVNNDASLLEKVITACDPKNRKGSKKIQKLRGVEWLLVEKVWREGSASRYNLPLPEWVSSAGLSRHLKGINRVLRENMKWLDGGKGSVAHFYLVTLNNGHNIPFSEMVYEFKKYAWP